MLKSEARKKYMDKRAMLSTADVSKFEDLMLIQFQQLPIYIPAYVLAYHPFDICKEYDPALLLQYCKFKNPEVKICYPVIDKKQYEMQAVYTGEADDYLIKNKYGINEPDGGEPIPPDLIGAVLVPLLAFDVNGNRVGYGKGYFDRFLATCRPQTIKIGCSFFEAEPEIADIDHHDIPLDYCITPLRSYTF